MRTVYASGDVMTTETELHVTNCRPCGAIFAIPESLYRACQQDEGQHFYCVACGRSLIFSESEAQKLKRELRSEQARRVSAEDQAAAARAEAEHQAARARGYKGAMVHTKKRAAKGVCPVPGCRRHFVDVQRHVESKHPGWDGGE
jgi:hypothetical protein